jgi:hypothetical protein
MTTTECTLILVTPDSIHTIRVEQNKVTACLKFDESAHLTRMRLETALDGMIFESDLVEEHPALPEVLFTKEQS